MPQTPNFFTSPGPLTMHCQYLGYNRDSTQSNPAGLLVMDDRWTAAGISETFLREKSPLIQPIRLHQNKKNIWRHLPSLKLMANAPKNGCFGIGAFPIGVFQPMFRGRFLLLVSAWGFLLPKGRSNGLDPRRHSQLSRAPRTRLARCCSCHWETNCSTNLPGFSIQLLGAPKLRENLGFSGKNGFKLHWISLFLSEKAMEKWKK